MEAQSLDDELEEGVFGRLWTMRGFGQAWHWLREKRRAASTPLHAFLTYVTLPWQSLVAGSQPPTSSFLRRNLPAPDFADIPMARS